MRKEGLGEKNNTYTEKEYVETYNRIAAWLHNQGWEGVLKGRADVSFLEDATEMVLLERADAVAETQIAKTPHYHVAKYDGKKLLDECGRCGLDLRNPIHYRSDPEPAPEQESTSSQVFPSSALDPDELARFEKFWGLVIETHQDHPLSIGDAYRLKDMLYRHWFGLSQWDGCSTGRAEMGESPSTGCEGGGNSINNETPSGQTT